MVASYRLALTISKLAEIFMLAVCLSLDISSLSSYHSEFAIPSYSPCLNSHLLLISR